MPQPPHHFRPTSLWTRLLAVIAPPVVHLRHGRYHGRPLHLGFDTGLSLVMLVLLVANIFIAVRPAPEPNSLQVSVSGPDQAISGTTSVFTLTIKNTGHRKLEHVTVRVVAPTIWSELTIRDRIAQDPETWTFGPIAAGQTVTSNLQATVIGTVGSVQTLRVIGSAFDGQQDMQTSARREVMLSATAIQLEIDTPSTLTVGVPADVQWTVRNTGSRTIDTAMADIAWPAGFTLVSAEPKLQTSRRWNIPALDPGATTVLRATLKPASVSQGKISADIFIRHDDMSAKQISRSVDVKSQAPLSSDDVASGDTKAAIVFATEAHYFTGAGIQLGYGPLPPVVGERTVYRVFWYIRSTRPTAGLTVTATLPDGVSWNAHQSVTRGQAMTYTGASRSVQWNVGAIDQADETVSGSFEVALVPTSAMVGRAATVLNLSSLTGLSEAIRAPAVTTAITDVPAKDRIVITH